MQITFTLTQKDIRRYTKMIEEFPLQREEEIVAKLPMKLRGLVVGRKFSSFILELINDIEVLYEVLAKEKGLSELSRKRILFALNYFYQGRKRNPRFHRYSWLC